MRSTSETKPRTPINISVGLFKPITPWSHAPGKTAGGVTVTCEASEPAPGITVTGPTGSIFHPTVSSFVSKYLLFGDDHNVLILSSGTGPGPVGRAVSIIDFTGPSPVERLVFLSMSNSAAVNEPIVHGSPGNGKAFLIWSSSGNKIQNVAIHRSDNGQVICEGPPPFAPTGTISADATPQSLIIRYSILMQQFEKRAANGHPSETKHANHDPGIGYRRSLKIYSKL